MTYQKAFAEAVKEIRKLIDEDTEAHTKMDSILQDLKINRLMIWKFLTPQQDHRRLKHPINSTVENLVFLDPLESEGSKNI